MIGEIVMIEYYNGVELSKIEDNKYHLSMGDILPSGVVLFGAPA